MTETLIQGYKVPFAPFRSLNKGKRMAVDNLLWGAKGFTNLIWKDMYEGTSKWRGMTKEDKIFVRKYYERFGQSKDGMSSKSFYIQSVIGDAENQYYDTIKSFSEIKKLGKTKSKYSKKPYREKPSQFYLDNRHLPFSKKTPSLTKDEKGYYWLRISHPSMEHQRELINLPLAGNKHCQKVLDSIVDGTMKDKYSFSITLDGIEIITQKTFELNKLEIPKVSIKEFSKVAKGMKMPEFLEKIHAISKDNKVTGVDFGKHISTSNGTIFHMNKMYKKIEKLNGQIADLQNRIQKLKDSKDFGEAYKALKEEKISLYKRIMGIRKSSYFHIAKKILQEVQKDGYLAIEDLSIKAIERSDEKYKGKRFNKMMATMGRSEWMKIIQHVVLRGGSPALLQPAQHTSQSCPHCGHVDRKNRNGTRFRCVLCGHTSHADYNGSVNVMLTTGAGIYVLMVKGPKG